MGLFHSSLCCFQADGFICLLQLPRREISLLILCGWVADGAYTKVPESSIDPQVLCLVHDILQLLVHILTDAPKPHTPPAPSEWKAVEDTICAKQPAVEGLLIDGHRKSRNGFTVLCPGP